MDARQRSYPRSVTKQFYSRYQSARAKLYPDPPFEFLGVTARVFPLAADMHRLRALCDSYLNLDIPEHFAHFQPALPYVYLAVLRYGKMRPKLKGDTSSEKPREQEVSRNRAWVSQYEVAFLVPLERYKEENGRMVFVDWAWVAPFIFVDDDISLTAGREVYGWPKLAARIDPDIDAWIKHPRNPSQLLTLSTPESPSVSFGEKEELRKLLKIEIEPPPTFSQLRPASNPLSLFLDGPQMALETLASMSDWVRVLAELPLVGFSRLFDPQERPHRQTQSKIMAKNLRDLGSLWADIPREQILNALLPGFSYQHIYNALFGGLVYADAQLGRPVSKEEREQIEKQQSIGRLPLHQITLKQFRDAKVSDRACYQEIADSKMQITSYKNGGLLGDAQLSRGDPTGGFQLHIYRKLSERTSEGTKDIDLIGDKIVTALGLTDEEGWKETTKENDKEIVSTVVTLKPIYPVWAEVDLLYGEAETVCWRTTKEWRGKPDKEETPPQDGEGTPSQDKEVKLSQKEEKSSQDTDQDELPQYITAGGTPEKREEPAEAHNKSLDSADSGYEEVLLSVYPLHSKRIKGLQEEQKAIQVLNRQLSSNLQLKFEPYGTYVYLLVLSYRDEEKGTWDPREVAFSLPLKWREGHGAANVALFSPFVFVAADNDAILDRERTGRPTMDADLTFFPEWPQESQFAKLPSLKLATEILEQDADAPAGLKELVTIDHEQGQPSGGIIEGRKDDPPLEIEAFIHFIQAGNPIVINSVMWKRLRDTEKPNEDFCYQAIVLTQREIKKDGDFNEIQGTPQVRIHQYADYPIIEELGLIATTSDPQCCQPQRSFWVKTKMKEVSRENLYQKAHKTSWKRAPLPRGGQPGSYKSDLASRIQEPFEVIRGLLGEQRKFAGIRILLGKP